jgi:hypothetical protein
MTKDVNNGKGIWVSNMQFQLMCIIISNYEDHY